MDYNGWITVDRFRSIEFDRWVDDNDGGWIMMRIQYVYVTKNREIHGSHKLTFHSLLLMHTNFRFSMRNNRSCVQFVLHIGVNTLSGFDLLFFFDTSMKSDK